MLHRPPYFNLGSANQVLTLFIRLHQIMANTICHWLWHWFNSIIIRFVLRRFVIVHDHRCLLWMMSLHFRRRRPPKNRIACSICLYGDVRLRSEAEVVPVRLVWTESRRSSQVAQLAPSAKTPSMNSAAELRVNSSQKTKRQRWRSEKKPVSLR